MVPNGNEIYQAAIKIPKGHVMYQKVSIPRPSQIYQKTGFLVCRYTIYMATLAACMSAKSPFKFGK
jgi:hypothetical protein